MLELINIFGISLFFLGLLYFFFAHLQHATLISLLPSYIGIICGAGLLLLAEWKEHKSPPKYVSIFAILCFIVGFSSYFISVSEDVWVAWVCLAFAIFSIIFGIIFKIENKMKDSKLVGNSLFVTGIILGVPIFIIMLLVLIFKIE